MKQILIIFLIFTLQSIAWAEQISLSNYISYVLRDSDTVMDNEDSRTYAKMSLDSANHEFDTIFAPNSSFSFQNDVNNQTIGLSADKNNVYGGNLYSRLNTGRDEAYSDTDYTSSLTVGYSQSLLKRLGKDYNTLNIYISKKNLELTNEAIKDASNQLIIDAVKIYYNVILNRKKIIIYEEALKRAKHNYDAAYAKHKTGIVSKIDVYRAEMSYLDAKQNLKYAVSSYEEAVDNALDLLAVDVDTVSFQFSDPILFFEYQVPQYDSEVYLKRRVEWKEMLINEGILSRKFYNAKRDLWPDLALDISNTYSATDEEYSDSWNLENENEWKVMITSDYTFDKFSEKQEIVKLRIEKHKLLREKNAMKRSLIKEISKNYDNFDDSKYTVEIQKQKMENAVNALDVAKKRYEMGLSDNTDVMDAESSLLDAEISYYSSIISYNISLLTLAKSVGELDEQKTYAILNNSKVIK